MKKLEKIILLVALLMSPLVPAFWLHAANVAKTMEAKWAAELENYPALPEQALTEYAISSADQNANNPKSTILAGTVWLDKKVIGETGERFQFQFYLDEKNYLLLHLFNYRNKNEVDLSQIPLSYVRAIQTIIEKKWKKSSLSSEGKNAILTVLQNRKNIELLKECQALTEDIERAFSKGKAEIDFWKAL